jgi:hypothetical protein
MRALFLRAILGTATLASWPTFAQMHKVAKPEQVVRAVGVYEWTGDFAKPAASRLIPVTVFIEGKLQDAGVYIARPIPFALLPGNVYILQSAGVDKATLDLAYARHLQAVEATGDMAFDDGWFGYGSVKPLAAPRRTTGALKPSKTLPVITASSNSPHFGSKPGGDSATTTSGQSTPATPADTKSGAPTTASTTASPTDTSTSSDPDRPTMKRRNSDTASSGTTTTPSTTTSDTSSTTGSASTPADDPDRPTMTRRSSDGTASSSGTTTTDTSAPTTASTTQTGSTPADDPDRPTMTRRNSDGTTSGGSSTTTADTASNTSNGTSSADDPDRPTLKRHTAQDTSKANSAANDIGGVSAVGSLNDDPGRPNLHHGKPTSAMTETDLPKLTGLPPNLHQMVAVSDAVNRDQHPFTLEWDDAAQHQAVLQKMQGLAQAQLAAYGKAPAPAAPAAKKTTATPTKPHRPAAPAPSVPLLDEDLKAYTLSYGGAATYIYSANTGGTGAALRYVTIVAQADGLGDIKPAIQSVTDAAHLDRSPKMQFVDVVDAEASNRASLLFELRSQNARQFALYRVIASHPEQIFLTGTTQ